MKRVFLRGCCDPVLTVMFSLVYVLAIMTGQAHKVEDLIARLETLK